MNLPLGSPAQPNTELTLRDARGRTKRKLRVSLTDRCNLRCLYCMPETPEWLPRAQTLRQEEFIRLVRIFVEELGLRELRLTGGEPLMRKDVVEIVAGLNTLRPLGLERIAMTSNGVYLPRHAQRLREAGLDDLNVSLDSRTPETFRTLTGGDVEPVLRGIDAAREAGLPVKINAVIIRDYNEHEILPLARWAAAEQLPMRFIEFMPLDGRGFWNEQRVIGEREMLDALATEFSVDALPVTDEPARYYLLDGRHRLGIISTVTRPFCRRCDRLRLSATGTLYSCLFSATGAELRDLLRASPDSAALVERIRGHVWHKEAGYAERPGYVERPITMHHLGG
jgi:cyclic pyranopterin phosphate synthase